MKLQSFASTYFDQFLSTVAIRGFSFIKASSTIYEKFLWVAIIVAFVALTLWDIYKSIDLYQSQPTSSRFTLLINNSITFETPTVCIHTDFAALNTSFHERNLTELQQFLDNFNYIVDMDDFVSKSINTTEESASTLMYLLTIMITNIIRLEQFAFDPNKPQNFGFYKPFVPLPLPTTEFPGELIHRFFAKKLQNRTQAVLSVCEFLCHKMQVEAVRWKMYFETGGYLQTTSSPCEKCFWLGYYNRTLLHMICNQFPEREAFTVSKPIDFITIEFDPYAILKLSSRSTIFGSSALIGFGQSFGHRSLDDISIPYEQKTALILQLIGDYESVNTKHNPCSTDTFVNCFTRCQTDLITEYCNCTPLYSYPTLRHVSNLPDCGSENSPSNNGRLQIQTHYCKGRIPQTQSSKCIADCPESCKNVLFTYGYAPYKPMRPPTNKTVLQLSVIKFAYPVVVEYLSLDLNGLVIRFAGNLSLWLGASFIALIHVCVFIIKMPFERQKFNQLKDKTITDKVTRNSLQKQINSIPETEKVVATLDDFVDVVKYQTYGYKPTN